MNNVPLIDISSFLETPSSEDPAVHLIRQACEAHGFFYITGHQVPYDLQQDLVRLSTTFFSQPEEIKSQIQMSRSGRAWRGYFPVGAELTSGKPDIKEGLYFGIEHATDHPKVQNKTIMHGQNQYPDNIAEFKKVVDNYMRSMTQLGHYLMQLIALSLQLPIDYFEKNYTSDPWTLFRIFHYPTEQLSQADERWGVGEHTDYGVLTILKQDEVGGLQIHSNDQWIEAPFIANTFVCNLGDMLSKMTGGYYRATPHRVKNRSFRGRYSFPFFFDPGWDVAVRRIDLPSDLNVTPSQKKERWDHQNLEMFRGTYGEYITRKVSKVFPDLI